MLLKYICLESGVHPLQDGLYIIKIVLCVHVQRMREMNGCLSSGGNKINALNLTRLSSNRQG